MIRWLDHTADVQIEITCDSFEEVFAELVEGICRILVAGEIRGAEKKSVDLAEPTAEELLVSMGRTALKLFYGERWIPCKLKVHEASRTRLKGDLWGELFDPERHACQMEIKGITYHALSLERKGEKWRAVVTFDV